jgi:hypothetical protein
VARLNDTPIAAADLLEFATTDSDFGFEMRVLAQLRADGFNCLHSGTYCDPVTDKVRQFDIRATMDRGDSTLALAVECKNLRPNNPLLVSAVPRTPEEAFHDLVVCRPQVTINWVIRPVTGDASPYKPEGMVGKKTDQVGRDTSKELTRNDEATFEKLNQAVNSCHDLIRTLCSKASPPFRRVIVPVLVVPTGRLWQVDYAADGTMTTSPRQVEKSELFLDHTWHVPGHYGQPLHYRLSHIQIVTFGALAGIAESWLGPGGFFPE